MLLLLLLLCRAVRVFACCSFYLFPSSSSSSSSNPNFFLLLLLSLLLFFYDHFCKFNFKGETATTTVSHVLYYLQTNQQTICCQQTASSFERMHLLLHQWRPPLYKSTAPSVAQTCPTTSRRLSSQTAIQQRSRT